MTVLADGKGIIQDEQYQFPYHYLPRMDGGRFRFHEILPWGHEYLSYMNHVVDLVADEQWASLIDVGCGDGRLISIIVQRLPGRRVVGLDYSDRAIALARALVPDGQFVSGDITYPGLLPTPFDVATCIDTLEHIEPDFLPRFVKGIREQLRLGSRLIVTVPSTNLKLNKKHYQHFTAEGIRAVLGDSFEVERVYYINGSSRMLDLLRRLLTNRFYTVTHPGILTGFYKYYLRNFLQSDDRYGTRLVALCRAA